MDTADAIRLVCCMSAENVRDAMRDPDSVLRAAASWRHYPHYDWPRIVKNLALNEREG